MIQDSAWLLPPNASPLERALVDSTARATEVPVPVRDIWNPDTCPANLLAWLAWAFSVDTWNPAWTEEQKRSVIKNSLFVHKHKGTLGAIQRALASVGYTITIKEWWQKVPQGDPYTFEIVVGTTGIEVTDDIYATVERLVMDAKNVRSELARLAVSSDVYGKMYLALFLEDGINTEVLPYFPEALESTNSIFVGITCGAGDVIYIAPDGDSAFYNGIHTYNGAISY